jgi:hypothetical protein
MEKSCCLFVYCMYVGFSYAQHVGIGTTTPGSGLELKGAGLGAQQRITDPVSGNSLVLQGGAGSNLKVTGYNYGTGTAQPLFLGVDGANTLINSNGGSVGIGTTTPLGGYLLDVAGPIKTFGNTTHFVAQTTGGTNSWARLYMRSTSQSWFVGTSQNFIGNQLYIGDETFNQTRFSIQPAGGPIALHGNITQPSGYGMPKAMVFLNANGSIGRCYNGITGSTTGGCGFSSVRVNAGNYQVNFGFPLASSFFAVSAQFGCCPGPVSVSYQVFAPSTINVGTMYKQPHVVNSDPYDMPVMVIVY